MDNEQLFNSICTIILFIVIICFLTHTCTSKDFEFDIEKNRPIIIKDKVYYCEPNNKAK